MAKKKNTAFVISAASGRRLRTKLEAVDFVPMQVELQRNLEAVRDVVNANLPEGMLAPTGQVVVTLDTIAGSHARRSSVFGHFQADSWNVDGEKCDHIAFNPYHLADGGEQVAETLVHEYVHLVNKFNGIADTSRQGRFHNKRFAKLANATKMIATTPDDKIGVTTYLTEAGKTWLREEVRPDFGNISKILEDAPEKKVNTAVRFVCGACDNKATVSQLQANDGFVPICGHDHDNESMTRV